MMISIIEGWSYQVIHACIYNNKFLVLSFLLIKDTRYKYACIACNRPSRLCYQGKFSPLQQRNEVLSEVIGHRGLFIFVRDSQSTSYIEVLDVQSIGTQLIYQEENIFQGINKGGNPGYL